MQDHFSQVLAQTLFHLILKVTLEVYSSVMLSPCAKICQISISPGLYLPKTIHTLLIHVSLKEGVYNISHSLVLMERINFYHVSFLFGHRGHIVFLWCKMN